VAEKESLLGRIVELKTRLVSAVRLRKREMAKELERLSKGLRDPRKGLVEMWLRLDEVHSRIVRGIELVVRDGRSRLGSEGRALLLHSPAKMVTALTRQLDFQDISLGRAMNRRLGDKQIALSHLKKRIHDLSPLSVLNRGYSITRKLPEKRILRDTSGVRKQDQIQVLLAKGELECRVEKVDGTE
jgi:exodeoxyribonuclease VII large subunit